MKSSKISHTVGFDQTIPQVAPLFSFEKGVKQIRRALRSGVEVGLVYVDFSKSCNIGDMEGWSFVENIITEISAELHKWKFTDLPYLEVVAVSPMRGDDLIIFFIPKASANIHWTESLLSKMATTIREKITSKSTDHIKRGHYRTLELFLGWSVIVPIKGIAPDRLIYRSIREASDLTADQRFSEVSKLVADLEKIIDLVQFRTVFQPIINIRDSTILGYEALARGPNGTPFNNPDFIFNVAYKGRLLMRAERLAKLSALELARDIPKEYKLFLNIESELLFKPVEVLNMLREVGCEPGRIVFEITERKAVKDFDQLHSIVKMMMDEGYQFAIDDAGSGYASMESIAILEPNYIKIDQSIIRGINMNYAKQDVVKAFINLSQMRHSVIIAEGVEEVEECRMLDSLGIEYAQGYLFAQPAFPPPTAKDINFVKF